ncbi:hypothetical protein [Nocardia sp. NPDC050717]|uniref:hypothetical protein n=1 Tax=Nocardia sp. NPDC050717 TaxID=3157221 RepID=UPI0033F3ACB2
MSHNTIRSVATGVAAGAAVVAAAVAVDIWQIRRARAEFPSLTHGEVDPELAALDAELAARHEKTTAALRASRADALSKFRTDLLFAVDPDYVVWPADLSEAQLLNEIKVVKAHLLDVRVTANINREHTESARETELATQLRALTAEYDGRHMPNVYGREPVSAVDQRRYALAHEQVYDGREWPHNTEYAEVDSLEDLTGRNAL